jgi:hypothetical protein
MSTSEQMTSVQGRYDLRRGAGGYAPIVGALGALAVPGIIVLFTIPPKPAPQDRLLVTLAAGLLIISVIASLIGSVSLAGIAAEQELTANIPGAVMRVAVPVVISIIDTLAAFEVLSAIYLPTSKTLFALIAGAGGACGVFFTAFSVGDSWHTGPKNPVERGSYIRKPWIETHEQAYKNTTKVSLAGLVPIALGMILRGSDVSVPISNPSVNVMIWVGLTLSIAGAFSGNMRMAHNPDGTQIPLQPGEAYGTSLVLGIYMLLVMILMP